MTVTPDQIGSALPISATAVAKDDTRVAFQNGMSMPISQTSHAVEISQTSTPVEISISERIRTLAAQGLKVRDISSMLHIHPQMVLLLLDEVRDA